MAQITVQAKGKLIVPAEVLTDPRTQITIHPQGECLVLDEATRAMMARAVAEIVLHKGPLDHGGREL